VNAAGLKEGQVAAAREKLDICCGDISNDIESIVYHGDAGQALVIHHLKSFG
jgi:hypothetical protein